MNSVTTLMTSHNTVGLIDTGFAELESWLDQQVYPDGVETEEAFGYDMWTAQSFFNTISLLAAAGHDARF